MVLNLLYKSLGVARRFTVLLGVRDELYELSFPHELSHDLLFGPFNLFLHLTFVLPTHG